MKLHYLSILVLQQGHHNIPSLRVHSDMDPLAARSGMAKVPEMAAYAKNHTSDVSDSSVSRQLVVRPCKLFVRRVFMAMRRKCVPRQWMCAVMRFPSVIYQLFVSFVSDCQWNERDTCAVHA